MWMHPNPWGIAKAFTQPWHGEIVRIRARASARHQTSCFVQVQANPARDVSSAHGVVGADRKSNPGRQQWGESVRKHYGFLSRTKLVPGLLTKLARTKEQPA